MSDPEAVFEQVKELFDLAEEVLGQQIDRSQSESAIASHDEEPRPPVAVNRNGNGTNGFKSSNGARKPENTSPPQNNNGNGEEIQPATNKQVQYLLSIGKRQRLTTVQLEKKIAEIIGRPVGIYDLSKMAAGIVIEARQIDRSQSESAIASHDEEPRPQAPVNRNGNGTNGSNGIQRGQGNRKRPSPPPERQWQRPGGCSRPPTSRSSTS